MIKQLRKASEHLYTRIFIGLIVVAFILWGINDFRQNNMNGDVVQLKYSDNIGMEEFLIRKRENLIKFQQTEGFTDSKEELQRITNLTLDQLINERLVNQIVKSSKVDIDEQTFYDYIKKLKPFQNNIGEFDKEKFNRFLLNASISEQEFIDSYKQQILKGLIFDNYINSVYVPEMLSKNILNYSLETRIFDVASIDLTNTANISLAKYAQKDVEEFYKKNLDLFKIKESRNINYTTISYDDLIKDLRIKDNEIENYYKENQLDFEGRDLNQCSKEIQSILESKQKSEEINKFTKLLEDEIASGASLDEIAKKYRLETYNISNFTIDYNQPDLKDFKNTIIGMQEKEVSYPIEIKDGLIILEVEKINPSRIPELSEIQKSVEAELKKDLYRNANLESITNFSKVANKENFIPESTKYGLKLNENLSITRKEYKSTKDLPEELINEIFAIKSLGCTRVVIDKNKAFVAFIRNIEQKTEDKNSTEQILNNIQDRIKVSFIDDIILYLSNINKVKINNRLLESQNSES